MLAPSISLSLCQYRYDCVIKMSLSCWFVVGGLFLCWEVGWGVGGNDRHFYFFIFFKATGKQSVLDSCSNSSSIEFINSSNKQNQFKYFFVLFTLSFSLGMIFFSFFFFCLFVFWSFFFAKSHFLWTFTKPWTSHGQRVIRTGVVIPFGVWEWRIRFLCSITPMLTPPPSQSHA